MTIFAIIAIIGAILSAIFFRKGGIYNPVSSTDNDVIIKLEHTTTPPVTITESVPLLWDTPRQAWHSVRVMCDSAELPYELKNEICYTIYNESEFKKGAIGKPNKNGSRDYGICQYNTGKNAKGIPFWIGEGATFKDIDEVLNNPEKCVRVMIQTVKAGNIRWWYGHKGYTHPVPKSHPMWKLRVI